MAPPLLTLQNIHLTFGGTPLLEGAELILAERERVCLVGRNGSGKSTLLKIAAALVEADRGTRFVQPGATIRYLPQEPDLSGFSSTLAYVEAGLAPGDDPHRARYLLAQLGLTGDEDPARLSGGEARRAALARVLAPEPDILLLDEPTNHLDLPAIEWLESELAGARSALVLISHDRRFLQRLSRATVWLDRGVTRRIEKGFASFEQWRDLLLEEEEREQHKLGRKIAAEEHWMRYGVTGRRKRNMRRVGELKRLRQEFREHRGAQGNVKIAVSEAELSGRLVVEARNIAKSFGATPVVRDFSLRIQRGDRIGLVGPNGAGKTTLLKMLIGALAPDAGSVRLGANIQMATLDQGREALDPNVSVRDTLTGGRGDSVFVGGQTRHVVGYMKDFLFTPEQAGTPVSALSGGERGRLTLARALARPSNLLVLDEPTNDLDLETLDLLEEMIDDYPGTVLLVSHDRDFLDRTVSAVIVAERGGRWNLYAGGYSDMVAQRGQGVTATGASAKAAKAEPEMARAKVEPPVPPAPKARLSFKDKHALETLPARIAALEADVAKLSRTIADPNLYARDRAGFDAASAALAQAQADLSAAEDDWLRLEELRERVAAR